MTTKLVGIKIAASLVPGAVTVTQAAAQAQDAKPATTHRTAKTKSPGELGPSSAACGTGAPDLESSHAHFTIGEVNMRSGSSTSCSVITIAYGSDRLDYHCYTYGSDGYTWTYLRNDSKSPDAFGWIRDDKLLDGGSVVLC